MGASTKAAVARARTRLNRIPAADGAPVSLGLLERQPVQKNALLPPMLLMHGATLGASVFDLPRAGYSLMEEMASNGRSVYAIDVRGFGHPHVERLNGTENVL